LHSTSNTVTSAAKFDIVSAKTFIGHDKVIELQDPSLWEERERYRLQCGVWALETQTAFQVTQPALLRYRLLFGELGDKLGIMKAHSQDYSYMFIITIDISLRRKTKNTREKKTDRWEKI
jgi:hypothetical protein